MFTKELLKKKIIIITGGGTGLGKSMAQRFGELGANLVITSRKLEVLEETAEELRTSGANVLPLQCDVRKPDEVEEMISRAVGEFGAVDVLVNITVKSSADQLNPATGGVFSDGG